MNIEDVKSLISLIDDSTLTELHYQTGDFQLLLSKNKLVQTATLIDGVLVIRFQFVDANYLQICHC